MFLWFHIVAKYDRRVIHVTVWLFDDAGIAGDSGCQYFVMCLIIIEGIAVLSTLIIAGNSDGYFAPESL